MSHYPTYDSWGSRSDQANSCKLQEAQLSCCRRISIWHILFEHSLIVMHMTSLHMTRSPMISSVMETGSDQILKAVWSTVQWTVSLHIRAQHVRTNLGDFSTWKYLYGEQCKKLWCLSLQENLSDWPLFKMIQRWRHEMACILSPPNETVSTSPGKVCILFAANLNLWKFLLSIAFLFYPWK